jgi:uncharacterized membrane protein
MGIRNFRERIYQSVSCELGGILVVAPVYALVAGAGAQDSLVLMVALTTVATLWAFVHNAIFDVVEWRLVQRVASDRPQAWRLVHAVNLEATLMVFTVPVLMIMGGHPFLEAVMFDIGLSLAYMVYAYVFHMAYDWARPVR